MKFSKYRQFVSAWRSSNVGLRPRRMKVRAFTLAELILVIVILSIAALMALPFAVSGSSMQLRSAANMIAADLEYAKSMAISRGSYYKVVFYDEQEKYEIQDFNTSLPIEHPIRKDEYVIDFARDSRLNRVDIASVNFDSQDTIVFDYLGSPFSSNGEMEHLISTGEIILSSGGATIIVNVAPVTGYITITAE